MEKIFWKVPEKIIAVGNNQKQALQKTYSIDKMCIETIQNGVENNVSNIDYKISNLYKSKNRVIVGTIASFTEQKGLFNLLDAAYYLKKRKNDFILLMVGDGYLRKELEKKCRQLKLNDTVYFLGWERKASTRILPIFDIFVQPSLWEAMSIVVLEAIAAEKPVLLTDVGENKHIINCTKSGYLIQPKDIAGMVFFLEKLIKNHNLRHKFSKNAKNNFQKFFSLSQMVNKYESIYTNALNGSL
jgi:glycosyltransferase involved in cell wall biosynthesis